MHILPPEIALSWISRKIRMTLENISWSISIKECSQTWRESNCWSFCWSPSAFFTFCGSFCWSPMGCASVWANEARQWHQVCIGDPWKQDCKEIAKKLRKVVTTAHPELSFDKLKNIFILMQRFWRFILLSYQEQWLLQVLMTPETHSALPGALKLPCQPRKVYHLLV